VAEFAGQRARPIGRGLAVTGGQLDLRASRRRRKPLHHGTKCGSIWSVRGSSIGFQNEWADQARFSKNRAVTESGFARVKESRDHPAVDALRDEVQSASDSLTSLGVRSHQIQSSGWALKGAAIVGPFGR
jgi:hypothetical protein